MPFFFFSNLNLQAEAEPVKEFCWSTSQPWTEQPPRKPAERHTPTPFWGIVVLDWGRFPFGCRKTGCFFNGGTPCLQAAVLYEDAPKRPQSKPMHRVSCSGAGRSQQQKGLTTNEFCKISVGISDGLLSEGNSPARKHLAPSWFVIVNVPVGVPDRSRGVCWSIFGGASCFPAAIFGEAG